MDEQEALRHKVWCLEKVGFFGPTEETEEEALMRDKVPVNKMRLDDLDLNDSVRRQIEGRETDVRGLSDSSGSIAQNFCPGCGRAMSRDDAFCPGCGRPSKKLQVSSMEREREPEQPALAYEIIGPRLKGKLNLTDIDITVEVFDDQSVVVLMPTAVSLTIDRLGSETMGVFEVRLTAVREKGELGKAAAVTSLVTQSKELKQ